MSNDHGLVAIRRSGAYRAALVGLRLTTLALVLVVLTIALAIAGTATVAVKTLIITAFILGTVGVLVGWAGVMALTPKTSRYVGVRVGRPDLRRMWIVVKMTVKDTLVLRHW